LKHNEGFQLKKETGRPLSGQPITRPIQGKGILRVQVRKIIATHIR